MTHIEEAFSWLEYAQERLQDARDNFAMGKLGPAVSMAYHAAFYAAKGIIACARERDPKTHSGVRTRFGQLAVIESDFPPQVAHYLSDLAEQRGKADYDLGARGSWSSDDVQRTLEMSETFTEEARSWFDRHVTQ